MYFIMISLKIIILIFLITSNLSVCNSKCSGKIGNTRIYKGKNASKDRFPWYIDLTLEYPEIKNPDDSEKGTWKGGGALISKKHILTVAHIFYPLKKDSFSNERLIFFLKKYKTN